MKLLSEGTTNAKTAKNEIRTKILYLAPYTLSGTNVCPYASKGCIEGCLNTAGMGKFSNVQLARISKTQFWANDRKGFYSLLLSELVNANNLAKKQGVYFAVRLNGTSDIDHAQHIKQLWNFDILQMFTNLKFYDYTKGIGRVKKYAQFHKDGIYHLTFSKSETNWSECLEALGLGFNVAVVFDKVIPSTYEGYEVVNGDETDLRINDRKGVIIGLKAKGKAKKDKSGFVVKG